MPYLDQLIHGNKTYLGVTSLIGLVALIGGVLVLLEASGVGLGFVMGAMVVLWQIATIHHSRLAEDSVPPRTQVPEIPTPGLRASIS